MKTSKHYRRLQSIAATRVRLGFSQQAFAFELGISRGLLSMVETKKRTLPTGALCKLAGLEIQLAATATANVKITPHSSEVCEGAGNEYAAAILQYKQLGCTAEAQRKQCQLELMMARYKQLRQSLDDVEVLMNDPASQDRFLPGHLQMHHFSLLHRLHKCNLVAQANLRSKIALLHAAAGLHEVTARVHAYS